MIKKLLLVTAFSLMSCSAFAKVVSCPAPSSIVTTGQVDVEEGIPGFIYCSPSEAECKWKGIDPLSDQISEVAGVINVANKPTKHNGLTYCDYELKNGSKIRMTLSK